jgi:anti-anti-sigma factor
MVLILMELEGIYMPMMSNLSDDKKSLTIAIQGRFDFSSLQAFRDSYEKVAPKPQNFTIDLKETSYIDSSALGMLLALRDYASEATQGEIKIINPNPDVRQILLITKLDEIFKVA